MFLDLTPIVMDERGRRAMVAILGLMEPLTGEIVRELTNDQRLSRPGRGSRLKLARRLLGVLRRGEAPPRAAGALLNPERARKKAYADVESFLSGVEQVQGATEALGRVEWLAVRIPGRVFARIIPVAALGIFSLSFARRLARRAGVAEDAMTITRGLAHNRTTEMNLDLWARAQRLRAAGAAELLEETPPAALARRYLAGDLPDEVMAEVRGFLSDYGFRAVAEIDAGVPRWEEDPTQVFAALASLMRIRDPAMAPDVQFERARASAEEAMRRALVTARPLKRIRLRFLFGRVRALAGVRESPKFYAIRALTACRRLLLKVGAELTAGGRLEAPADIFFLTLVEARKALEGADQRALVGSRKAERERELARRRLPRLLLSDGTCFYGDSAHSTAPGTADALAGTSASPASTRDRPGSCSIRPAPSCNRARFSWRPLRIPAGRRFS